MNFSDDKGRLFTGAKCTLSPTVNNLCDQRIEQMVNDQWSGKVVFTLKMPQWDKDATAGNDTAKTSERVLNISLASFL